MFLVSPTELIPTYIELVILPLKEMLLKSLNSKKGDKKIPEESKLEVIEGFELEEEDEMDYQILKFLLVSIHDEKVAKHLVDLSLQDTLYGILRTTCKAFIKDPIKLTPRVSKMAANIVSNLLAELDSTQLSTFKEIIYSDICTSIEEQKINFVLTIVMPILAGARYKVTPLCLHLDDEMEIALNQYRSKVSSYLSPEKNKGDGKGFNPDAFSNQEKTHLMQSIQQYSLTPLGTKQRVRLNVSRCEWRRLFKVDYATQFPFNSSSVHEDVLKNDGVLVVFHCLVNEEICKLGAFCSEPLVRPNPSVGYGTNTAKFGYATPESFVFYYSQTHKLHYLAEQPSLDDLGLAGNIGNFQGGGGGSHHQKNPLSKPLLGKKDLPPHKFIGKKPNVIPQVSKASNKVFVEFSDSKIAVTLNGIVLVEYVPSNPDNSKITPNFKGTLSEEEKKGQKVFMPFYDPSGFSCVQGVEFWILTYPKDQKQISDDDIFADFNSVPNKLLSEYLGYARTQPITLVPQDLTLGQILSLFSKYHEKDMVKKLNCRIIPQENIELVHRAQRVLDMYHGSTQGVLDLFVSSQEGINWLKDRFANREEKLYERILNFAKTESKMIQSLLAPERLAEILQKTKIIAGQKNKIFLTDFNTFYSQIQLFLKIDSYHEALIENDMLFYTLLQLIGFILKNDVLTYKSSCINIKLDHLLYSALSKVLRTKCSSEQFANVNMMELIHILLNKIAEANKTINNALIQESKAPGAEDGKIGNNLLPPQSIGQVPSFISAFGNWAQQINKKLEDSPIRKQAQAMERELSKKTFQNLLSCADYIFDKGLSTQAKREAAAKIKQLNLIIPISKFIGDVDESQNIFNKQVKNLLRKWSEDLNLSEIFWEPVSDSENRNGELKYTLYQMMMNHKEQAEQTLEHDSKEEFKSNAIDQKKQAKKMEANLIAIQIFKEIDRNLRRFYDIEIVEQTTEMSKFLTLPLPQAYPKVLKDLCVGSASMKGADGTYNHHYKTSITSNLNTVKTQRILKEIGDLTTSLPVSDTNAIFMRYDKQRMDVMKALIFGSKDTPYAHGAFIYDLYIADNYPSGPPMCNLETTGNHTVRFNPNLYSCGKVCLSLLGTWRGNANENWNPQLSTLLQVLISIQSIIMTEDVYYNEPGYESTKHQMEAQMLNEGYSNIVKYANVKFAMAEAIRNPAPWFKDVIEIHFYLKKDVILEDCNKWIEQAKTTNGKYTGLVSSHNSSLCSLFSGSKTAYYDKLVEAVKELKELFGKLNVTIDRTVRSRTVQWNKRAVMEIEDIEEVDIDSRVEKIDGIDVSYEEKVQQRAIDIQDEKVTNRWSRYIGAMGIEAVEKQANAQICLFGLNALGVEIAKNIILSGVKRFTICDGKTVGMEDLAGQFYLTENDIGKNRAKACLSKLQALNQYVIIDFIEDSLENCYKDISRFLVGYNVLIACEGSQVAQAALNDYSRTIGAYFVSATLHGLFSRIFCDFGENFKVLDKTGEEYQDLIIKSISYDDKGLITLLDGTKHNLQDGDEVMISQVVEDASDMNMQSLNGTQHKVAVCDKSSFYIGDTTVFKKYARNGVVRQMKQSLTINFKTLSQIKEQRQSLPPFDPTISFSDWNFVSRVYPLHVAFEQLDSFVHKFGRAPTAWGENDADIFLSELTKELNTQYPDQWKEIESSEANKKLFQRVVNIFSYTCSGVFPPLAAFIGGVTAQEAIKAITKKYMPINQFFYYETSEIAAGLNLEKIKEEIRNIKQDRDLALKICFGESLFTKLAASRLFMVGAGAIGCELLKNFAMLSLGTGKEKGKEGRIYLTDPDIIENSNLNRQFLFREKHIRKPKSTTAAAVAVSMNNKLHGNIMPLVEKVHDQTESLFSNTFFESLDVVANALDNINARRYVDSRCVKARKPLLESGTLGPKGHVQVIVPYKTESYGSQQDPQEDNEIPYCTLKMFPEETLHCVEWARDKFTKMYTQKPKSFEKILEGAKSYEDLLTQDHKILAEAYRFIKNWPRNFEDCIQWARNKFEKFFVNDIKQLLHVYPLDHKLENGKLFWTLPKRPPSTILFDPNNDVHASFIAACSCLRAVTCGIPIDKIDPRSSKTKTEIALQAAQMKAKEFVPSDKKSKSLKDQADKGKDGNQNNEENKVEDFEMTKEDIAKNILSSVKEKVGDLTTAKTKLKCSPQEFEKDEDENFHIDVLFGMTNCRAINYNLAKMDWITVKLKAGRIIPALATTTSAIAGLQTIELVKLLAKVEIEDHKNSFLNLSIPVLTQSEPSSAPGYKLNHNLTSNLWDRWEIDLALYDDIKTLETLFNHIKELTKLEPLDCLRGNTAVYIASLMNMPNKAKEKQSLLKQPLYDTLGIRGNQKFIDLTITLTSEEARLKNPKDIAIKGVPPIRLILPKTDKVEIAK